MFLAANAIVDNLIFEFSEFVIDYIEKSNDAWSVVSLLMQNPFLNSCDNKHGEFLT